MVERQKDFVLWGTRGEGRLGNDALFHCCTAPVAIESSFWQRSEPRYDDDHDHDGPRGLTVPAPPACVRRAMEGSLARLIVGVQRSMQVGEWTSP